MSFVDPYDAALAALDADNFSAFAYLKTAEELLANPIDRSAGRELVIRALDRRESHFAGTEPLLKQLVRHAGLYPYLLSEFDELSISEELAMRAHQTPFSSAYVFHSAQLKIYEMLINGRNVILSAPTSMGKSAIVDSLIASGKFKKLVIVLPTVALVDETRRRLSQNFGNTFQIIHHGSQVLTEDKAIFVLTQERVNDRTDLKGIDLFVLDEFYKLAFELRTGGEKRDDDVRVAALNSALSKLLKLSKQFLMTGPFINGVRGLYSINRQYTFFPTDYNTVALNIEYKDLRPNDLAGKDFAMLAALSRFTGPTIIYCKSSTAAGAIARTLIAGGLGVAKHDAFSAWLKQHYDDEWDFTLAHNHGIGMHYGGLPRAIQQFTIDRFNNGELRYLVCTSTIIEGVNTVAKNVIIYDNRNGPYGIDRFTHGNIRGRAGRMGQHFVGNVLCLEALPEGDDSFEVQIPLGQQDEETPINFLAGLQPEHLTDESQLRFDEAAESSNVGADLLRKHASFRIEDLEHGFNSIDSLDYNQLTSCIFHHKPNSGFSAILTEFLYTVSVPTLRTLKLIQAQDVVKAKINSYLFAESYHVYLKEQLSRIPQLDSDRSRKINDELKILNRLFAYTIPKALSLMEDLVIRVALRRNRSGEVSYAHIRSLFENYHLSAAWAGVEEMGIPVQTLHKLERRFPIEGEANVDTVVDVLCNQIQNLGGFTELEQHFIKRAIEPSRNARLPGVP